MLGKIHAVGGGPLARAQSSFEQARLLGEDLETPDVSVLARCHLAALEGGDVRDALGCFTRHAERLTPPDRMEACYLLWRATGERAHLEEAVGLLEATVADFDEETRAAALSNLRLHRDIETAWQALDRAPGTG